MTERVLTTAESLKRLQDAYEDAAEKAWAARDSRNDRVRMALADGWTHAAIADATGLTRGRIGQLAVKRGTRS